MTVTRPTLWSLGVLAGCAIGVCGCSSGGGGTSNDSSTAGTVSPASTVGGGSTVGGVSTPSAPTAPSAGPNTPQDGTLQYPFLIASDPLHPSDPLALPFEFHDARDTNDAVSDVFDSYPGATQDESGPEFIYRFVLDEPARVAATIDFSEPTGTDVDLHLMAGTSPTTLVARGHTAVYAVLQPGTYHLIMDTFVSSSGAEKRGPYELRLSVRSRTPAASGRFNDFILAAVDELYAKHRLQGYGSAVLTHDIDYGGQGTIAATGGAKTMCVAAVMEVMLTAMAQWADDRGDPSVYSFLPLRSWQTLHSGHIKAHIWVNHSLGSWGTADALGTFGMGETVPFEQLTPGAFVNLNRTTRTGHAVVFLAFVDDQGNESETWNQEVVGFKYFSAQGGSSVGAGGLDFRYAVFSGKDLPAMPYKIDRNVIYSTNQRYLNTGEMWAPNLWQAP